MMQTLQTPNIAKSPIANETLQASNNTQPAPTANFRNSLSGLGMPSGNNSTMMVLLALITQLIQQAQGSSTQSQADGQTPLAKEQSVTANNNAQSTDGENHAQVRAQINGNDGRPSAQSRLSDGENPSQTQINGNDGRRPAQSRRPTSAPAPAPANNSPQALNDVATTAQNTPVNLNVIANDTDPDGNPLNITQFSQPANGTVTQNGNQLTYTPNAGFVGADAFTYQITDGSGGTSSATASVDVTAPTPTYNATIQGANNIMEGTQQSFTVKLDRPVTEDTLITVRVDEKTAQRSDIANDNAQAYFSRTGFASSDKFTPEAREALIRTYAKRYAATFTGLNDPVAATYRDIANGGDIPYAFANETNRDFTVSSNGQAQTNDTFQVLVKAGQSESESFDINAWRETLSWHQGQNGDPTVFEGDEEFCLVVDEVGGVAPVGNNEKEVTIQDRFRRHGSPVALDLNHDGKIGTTGASTAQYRTSDTPLGETVQFDLDANGTQDTTEWMNGDGDGLLVDTSKINGNFIDGNALFGDQGGQFNNGYEKMALEDDNNDGKLSGNELDNLAVWVDDGDAKLEAGELRNLSDFGITELSTQKQDVQNDRGETLMQSSAIANGQFMLTEDVWFGQK